MMPGSEHGIRKSNYAWAATLPEQDYIDGVALICGAFGAVVIYDEAVLEGVADMFREQGYGVYIFRKSTLDK